MTPSANTLGRFIAELMQKHEHNNSSLAAAAGVSESVIRNLLKHGMDPRAKDPDARTLTRVAEALDVDALILFRLAGYISPRGNPNSPRADYLAEAFDDLPPEKQDAVMSVLEAMSESPAKKDIIHQMREHPTNALEGLDLAAPQLLRTMANELIAFYQMTDPVAVARIEPDTQVQRYKWKELPQSTQQRIKALIRHKLSLDYDPTMVDPEWRK